MVKQKLELDNSYIPRLTEINPNSWYLKYRRFYCGKKEFLNPLYFFVPMTAYFLYMILIGN
jgi:hypothetical protein